MSDLPAEAGSEPDDTTGIDQPLMLDVTWPAKSVMFSGPLPPPGLMAQYERLVPGSAERLFRLLEQTHERANLEQAHRHMGEDGEQALNKAGQRIALAITLVLIAVATLLTALDHDAVGGIIFSGTIVGVGALFYVGRRDQFERPPPPDQPSESAE